MARTSATGKPPLSPQARAARRRTARLLWSIYIGLGLVCAAAGAYLLEMARRGPDLGGVTQMTRAFAAVLIVFGVWRVALAVWQLRVIAIRSRGAVSVKSPPP